MRIHLAGLNEILLRDDLGDLAERLSDALAESYVFGCPDRLLPDLSPILATAAVRDELLDIYVTIANLGTAAYVPGDDPVDVLIEVAPVGGIRPAGGRNFVSVTVPLSNSIIAGGRYPLVVTGVPNISPSFSPDGVPGDDGVIEGRLSVALSVCIDPRNELVEMRKDNNDMPPGSVVVGEVRAAPNIDLSIP